MWGREWGLRKLLWAQSGDWEGSCGHGVEGGEIHVRHGVGDRVECGAGGMGGSYGLGGVVGGLQLELRGCFPLNTLGDLEYLLFSPQRDLYR